MTKRVEIKVALEKFLLQGDPRAASGVVRDHRRRAILVPETLVDHNKITASGRSLADLGRRIRVLAEDLRKEDHSYLVPVELCQISRDEPGTVAGVALPFGTIVDDHGLWLRYAPGYLELGVDDRGDVIIRKDPQAAEDPTRGPVRNAVTTLVDGPVRRCEMRLSADDHRADREE